MQTQHVTCRPPPKPSWMYRLIRHYHDVHLGRINTALQSTPIVDHAQKFKKLLWPKPYSFFKAPRPTIPLRVLIYCHLKNTELATGLPLIVWHFHTDERKCGCECYNNTSSIFPRPKIPNPILTPKPQGSTSQTLFGRKSWTLFGPQGNQSQTLFGCKSPKAIKTLKPKGSVIPKP